MDAGLGLQLTQAQYERWLRHLKPHRYPAGQALFYCNHRLYGAYVLGHGAIALKKNVGGAVKLRISAPALIGWEACLSQKPSAYTAMTLTRCEALFADIDRLHHLLREGRRLLPVEVVETLETTLLKK